MDTEQSNELLERIGRLEEQVRQLTAGAVPELRAQRLAIIDAEGNERVVIETLAGTGSVLVRVPAPDGATTGVELYASPADDGDGPRAGICVLRDGDVVDDWPSPGDRARA